MVINTVRNNYSLINEIFKTTPWRDFLFLIDKSSFVRYPTSKTGVQTILKLPYIFTKTQTQEWYGTACYFEYAVTTEKRCNAVTINVISCDFISGD